MTIGTLARSATSGPPSGPATTSRSALAGSFLESVDPRVVDALTRRAVVQLVDAGEVFVSETDSQWAGIVAFGNGAESFCEPQSGRQVTLRSATAGGSIGITAVFASGSISAQAITDCALLRLDTAQA